MNEKKFENNKQKLLTVLVTAILVIFFIGGFWIGLDRVRSMEGTFPPNDIKEGISAAPETPADAALYLEKVIEKALAEKPKLSSDDNFSIDSDSVNTDGSETFKATLLFAKDNFKNYISSVEDTEDEITEVNFGEDIASLLRVPALDGLEIVDFTCNYIYYQCPSCGVTSDEQLSSCEPCGSNREYFKKYRPEYEIELTFSPDMNNTAPNAFRNNYAPRSESEIDALTDGVFSDVAEIKNRDYSYTTLKIYFKVNRLTDEITYLSYIKGIDVSADVKFFGKYEALGTNKVSFSMNEYMNFGFTWPSLTLNNEELVIEPKGTDNLLATLTCEDPLAMTVTWVSSDESIATVDAEGYIKATAKTGDVDIIATYEYLGETYSDSCTVHVRVPVESMKMNKKSVELGVGETFTLATKVSPAKATVQTVKWYSENDDIATVDENGVVTAKSKGTVVVYALSDDGYYRSTCEVTVE